MLYTTHSLVEKQKNHGTLNSSGARGTAAGQKLN